MKNLTFSQEGLKKIQIDFLTSIEELYFKGVEINSALMHKEALKYKGTEKALQIIEAFDYWEFMPKPLIKESLKKPINLSDLLIEDKNGAYLCNYKNFKSGNFKETKKLKDLKIDMLKGLTTYYQLTNNCLYIKYNEILGGRFIAVVKNDIKILK